MKFSVVKIERHINDANCYTVVLKIQPNRWQRLLGRQQKIESFTGHKNSWYYTSTMSPAPTAVRNFLVELFFSGEFRHLLSKVKLESAQKAPPPHKKKP